MQWPHHFLTIPGVCLLLACGARAADKPDTQPVSINALIVQLGDKNFRVRQAAGRELAERGEEALPALRKALESNDEEVHRRVEVLTEQIERTALISAKRITVHLKNQPIQDAIKELSRLTGYKLQFQGGQARTISIDMEKATYWQVLEKICNEGQLSPGFDDQQGIVYLYQQNTISPYTYLNGPFRFVAQNFNYNRYVNLANLPRNGFDPNMQSEGGNLSFGFMIQAEPKTPILSVSPPRLTKAVDENGTSLLPHVDENQPFVNVQYNDGNGLYRNFQHSTAVQMIKPAKDATQAKLVKGAVNVTLLAGVRPDVTFDNLKPGKKKLTATGESADVQIDDVVEQGNVWTLTLLIRRHVKDGEQPDYNWINGIQQKLELYDAKGNKFVSQGVTNFINNTPTSVNATYQFGPQNNIKMGPAAKFVLVEWLTISHELEFEFKNLPLP